MTAGQRAMVALDLEPHYAEKAKGQQGRRTDLESNIVADLPECSTASHGKESREQAAAAVGASGRVVGQGKAVGGGMTRRRPVGVAAANASKERCIRGHLFDAANTLRWVDGRGYWHRQCRACNRMAWERKRQRRPAGPLTNERTTGGVDGHA